MCAKVNFTPVRKLAEEFKTSLTATAIRFVRFCPEMCALVFSKDSKISWIYYSEDWWPFIRPGQPLDSGTVAYDFFQGRECPNEPLEIDGNAWVDNGRVESIVEHSVASPAFGYVLSLLWIRS